VIAVLLASTRVVSGGLNMAAWTDANPHVAVRGRDGEAANAGELSAVADSSAVRMVIEEAASPARTADARIAIAGKEESLRGDDLQRLGLGLRGCRRLAGLGGTRGLFTQFSKLLQRVTDLRTGSVACL
jgi:hypothetical protein